VTVPRYEDVGISVRKAIVRLRALGSHGIHCTRYQNRHCHDNTTLRVGDGEEHPG
jgi:hypothetical protein